MTNGINEPQSAERAGPPADGLREILEDFGVALLWALAIVILLTFGTSASKFIYIDF